MHTPSLLYHLAAPHLPEKKIESKTFYSDVSISFTISHELNAQGPRLARCHIKMGKDVLVFTFSPRTPRIPGGP